jgi:hypothetical protein
MIHSKIIYFRNKRNDFAQNDFAEILESKFHTRGNHQSSLSGEERHP